MPGTASTRVVIVTDEQTRPGWLPSNADGLRRSSEPQLIDDLIPRHVPLYMWNFGGYGTVPRRQGRVSGTRSAG